MSLRLKAPTNCSTLTGSVIDVKGALINCMADSWVLKSTKLSTVWSKPCILQASALAPIKYDVASVKDILLIEPTNPSSPSIENVIFLELPDDVSFIKAEEAATLATASVVPVVTFSIVTASTPLKLPLTIYVPSSVMFPKPNPCKT